MSTIQMSVLGFVVFPMIVALCALLGWALNIDYLRNWFPNQPPVAITTALCSLCSCAVALLTALNHSQTSLRFARVISTVGLLISGAIFLNYLQPGLLDLDNAIMSGTLATPVGFSPGRMAPSTAACFVFMSIAGIIGVASRPRMITWSFLIASTIILSATIFLGYMSGARQLSGVGIFTPMALTTALSFLFLGAAYIASQPQAGLMALLSGNQLGSYVARRLVPVAIAVPLAICYLRFLGERAGFFDDTIGNALVATLMFIAFAALVIWQAWLVNSLSEQRDKSSGAVKLLYHDLIEARDAALESARLKAEFLANMSHEIRTPMNAVIGCADMLSRTKLKPDQIRLVDLIINSGNALMDVINDILILSKIEAGKLELSEVELSVVELTESAGQLLAEKAQVKQLSLTTYVAPEVQETVLGDPQRLRQVLLNLLGNAVKFTETGNVTLRAELNSSTEDLLSVRFVVTDTGIGIAEEHLEKLFQPFTQCDGSITRKFTGTGLGLAISQRLVAMMGGSITVKSEVGVGTEFIATIPLTRCKQVTEDSRDIAGLRALVVGAPTNEFEVIRNYGSSWNVQAEYAPDAQSAIFFFDASAATGKRHELIICDDAMSGIDAFAFCHLVRSRLHEKSPTFVLVTQIDGTKRFDEAILRGFQHVLTKPLRQSELFNCFQSVRPSAEPRKLNAPRAIPVLNTFASAFPIDQCKHVLVVEDNPLNQEVVALQLKEIGFDVTIAGNGKIAIELLNSRQYGLILMDCQMPEMDGFQATQEIRRLEQARAYRTPIVAMTANAMEGDREACLLVGMDDYISKPVTSERLNEIIERWFLVALDSDFDASPLLEERADITDREEQTIDTVNADMMDFLSIEFDPSTARKFVAIFGEQTPPLLDKLDLSIGRSDFTEMQARAHELKGSCYAVHCELLAKFASEIENAARHKNREQAIAGYNKFVENFHIVQMNFIRTTGTESQEEKSVDQTKAIRLFLIEDNELTRLGLRSILTKYPEFVIVGEAEDGLAAVNAVLNADPQVVIVDIGLPHVNGIEVTRRFKMANPGIKALMLTSHDSEEDMLNAFAAGADGYIVKHTFDHHKLKLAIETVVHGSCWLDPAIARRILTVTSSMSKAISYPGADSGSIEPLSPSEKELLTNVAENQADCQNGVCQVQPGFLENLHRFARRDKMFESR